MNDSDQAIVLLRKLGELHRPVLEKYPDSDKDTYQARCPSCDGNTWRIWRKGDPPVQCSYWAEYQALWGVST